MTTLLYDSWHKVKFYKNLFILFFSLNVLCLMTSLVLFVSYFQNLSQAPEKTQQLILIGALTFCFGILLPSYLFYKIMYLLNSARRELESTARELATEWLKHMGKYDDEPFKNVDFWLNSVLLSAEQIGRYYPHPMANLGGEMAGLVRQEIKKIKKAS